MTSLTRNSRTHRNRVRLGTLLVGAAMLMTYAAGEVGNETARAAEGVDDDPGTVTATATGLTVEPASGSTNGFPIALKIPAPCPDTATDFIVEISGGGFPTGSFVLGLTQLDPVDQTLFPVGGDWKAVAGNNGASLPLRGPANLKLICTIGQEPAGSDYTTSVTFTPSTGTDSTFVTTEGPAGSPTPVPSGSPTPVPSGTPVPSTTATPVPSQSPSPSSSPAAEDPTPTPCVTVVPEPTPSPDPGGTSSKDECDVLVDKTKDDSTSGDDVTADEALPDAGGKDPSMFLLLAAMFGSLGLALLLFEAASRPREEWV